VSLLDRDERKLLLDFLSAAFIHQAGHDETALKEAGRAYATIVADLESDRRSRDDAIRRITRMCDQARFWGGDWSQREAAVRLVLRNLIVSAGDRSDPAEGEQDRVVQHGPHQQYVSAPAMSEQERDLWAYYHEQWPRHEATVERHGYVMEKQLKAFFGRRLPDGSYEGCGLGLGEFLDLFTPPAHDGEQEILDYLDGRAS